MRQSIILLSLLQLVLFNFIHAQSWQQVSTLESEIKVNDLQLGAAVAIYENTAVVGAVGEDTVGAVYVYDKNSDGVWNLTQILKPSDGNKNDQFGSSLSIHKNRIAIGSIWHDFEFENGEVLKEVGSVYIFEKEGDNWKEKEKIYALDGSPSDQFGISIDLHEDKLLVGSIWNDFDDKGKKFRVDAGAAYYFKFENGKWNEKQKLIASDRVGMELFGISVSLENDHAAIGAYRNSLNAKKKEYREFAGAAYIFKLDETGIFQEVQKIVPNDREAKNFFAYHLHWNDTELLVSAHENSTDPNDDNRIKESGAVYSFLKQGELWVQNQKIVASNRQKKARFGESLATDGKYLVVGALGHNYIVGDVEKDSSGAVYVFEKQGNSWSEISKLIHHDVQTGDNLGIAVGINGNNIVAGAWGKTLRNGETKIYDHGAAYVFAFCNKPQISVSIDPLEINQGEEVFVTTQGAPFFEMDYDLLNGKFKPEKDTYYHYRGYFPDGCNSLDSFTIKVNEVMVEVDSSVLEEESPEEVIANLENNTEQADVIVEEDEVKDAAEEVVNSVTSDVKEYVQTDSKPQKTELRKKLILDSRERGDYNIIEIPDNTLVASTKQTLIEGTDYSYIANLKTKDSEVPLSFVSTFLVSDDLRVKTDATDVSGFVKYDMLDPDKDYEIVLNFNDPKLTTQAFKGDKELVFNSRKIINDIGQFEILTKITYADNGNGISGIEVNLVDENGTVLKTGLSDLNGIFSFENLESDHDYKVLLSTSNPNIKISAYGPEGEIELKFTESAIDLQNKEILASLNYIESGNPVIGMNINLTDDEGNILKLIKTNNLGQFKFENLASDKNYKVNFDFENPRFDIQVRYDDKLILVENKKVLNKYAEMEIIANLKYQDNGDPAVGLDVFLFDSEGNLIAKGKSNSLGKYKFENLPSEKDYNISFDESAPNIDVNYYYNSNQIRLKTKVSANALNQYEHLITMEYENGTGSVPNADLMVYDENWNLITKGQTSESGEFKYTTDNSSDIVYFRLAENSGISKKYLIDGKHMIIEPGRLIQTISDYEILARLLNQNGEEQSNIPVCLKDSDGIILKTGITSEKGWMRFQNLDKDLNYSVDLNPSVEDVSITFFKDGQELKLELEKVKNKLKGFDVIVKMTYSNSGEPAANIPLLAINDKDKLKLSVKTDENGIGKFPGIIEPDEYRFSPDPNADGLFKVLSFKDEILLVKAEKILNTIATYEILTKIEYAEDGGGVEGLEVLFFDENGSPKLKGVTNKFGEMKLENIPSDKYYFGNLDLNQESLKVLAKYLGEEIVLEQKRIVNTIREMEVLSQIKYADSDNPAVNVPVMLVDEDGNILKRGMTDDNGNVRFTYDFVNDKKVYVVLDRMEYEGDFSGLDKTFSKLYFDFNVTTIRKSDQRKIDDVVKYLKDNPDKRIQISAHTDNVGSNQYNLRLSEQRAKNVMMILLDKGINKSQISINPEGMKTPLASNSNEVGRQLNRRVEFIRN